MKAREETQTVNLLSERRQAAKANLIRSVFFGRGTRGIGLSILLSHFLAPSTFTSPSLDLVEAKGPGCRRPGSVEM